MLAALFIAVPVVEIWVILEIGGFLGLVPTLGIIVITAMVGAALARRQGFAAVQQLQASLAEGRQVGRSLVEAALILAAGITLLTPGFVTDAVGLALLLPPLRAPVASFLVKWAGRRMTGGDMFVAGGGLGGRGQGDEARGRGEAKRGRGEGDDEDPPPPGVIDV